MEDYLDASASGLMSHLWTPRRKARFERRFWVAVMRAQMDLGVDAIRPQAIDDYAAQVDWVDLGSIRRREMVLHHDVKARLEEFNHLAGHQVAHLGMTGRDLDDNVELYQQALALGLLAQALTQRGHSAVARDVQRLADRVPFRGLWGAVGTGTDQLQLLGGSSDKLAQLNRRVALEFGFSPDRILDCVGQVYPRSLDFQMASSLTATLGCLPRPQGPWPVLMRGYVAMLAELSGDQWAEGDVSCSSVRRVALPSLFLAASAWVNQLPPVNTVT